MNKNIFLAAIYFTLSTLFTAWFIAVAPMYISQRQMWLSGTIAGGKWLIQIVAGLLFLRNKKWEFVRRIGFTCLVGSLLLIPYSVAANFFHFNDPRFFVASLIIAVLVMIDLYFNSVRRSGISLRWWYAWLLCLAVAISLQLTVVFEVIRLN